MTAYVFLAEGFEEVEALTPVDILRRGGVTVKTVGIGGKTITGAHGIPVGCDIAEEDVIPDEIDMMVLPGGMPGTIHLGESLTIQEGLAYAAQEDLWVAAICAAPSVLGENGLLHGRKYTCYPGFENDEKYHGTYNGGPFAAGWKDHHRERRRQRHDLCAVPAGGPAGRGKSAGSGPFHPDEAVNRRK